VVAEVGATPDSDQIYRITFDGSVADEHGYVAMGGQADQVAAALRQRYSDGLSLTGALGVALGALSGQENGDATKLTASQLEVAVLNRAGEHRRFRRLTGARLEALLSEARASAAVGDQPASTGGDQPADGGGDQPAGGAQPGAGPAI